LMRGHPARPNMTLESIEPPSDDVRHLQGLATTNSAQPLSIDVS